MLTFCGLGGFGRGEKRESCKFLLWIAKNRIVGNTCIRRDGHERFFDLHLWGLGGFFCLSLYLSVWNLWEGFGIQLSTIYYCEGFASQAGHFFTY